jgi:hypothetical protein
MRRAFVSLQRGTPKSGSFNEAVHEFSVADFAANPKTYKLRPIPLVSELDDATVQEIFDASQDGSRLLISVHYCYARRADGTYYRWHPYFFDTRTGKLRLWHHDRES